MSEPRIHMRHVQRLRGNKRICRPGIRAWAARHGVDFQQLVTVGVPGEVALQIGDAFALRALEIARTEAASNGR